MLAGKTNIRNFFHMQCRYLYSKRISILFEAKWIKWTKWAIDGIFSNESVQYRKEYGQKI